MSTNKIKISLLNLFIILFIVVASSNSFAIPSFARQTNLPCQACHYNYPELNYFGRLFKLNGYTMTGIKTIQSTYKEDRIDLSLLKTLPLSAALTTSYTSLAKAEPGAQNGVVELPQEFGFYLSGEITPHVGGFLQVSYDDQGGTFSWDMVDVRYANHTTLASNDLLYGLTLNNSPTLQDVWNTTPGFGFPFVGSSVAPVPSASPMIQGGLDMMVAGLGAYALYDNLIYTELSVYKSTPQGGPFPADATSMMTIKNVATYWRLAIQQQWENQYIEVGTFGIATDMYPEGISGNTDNFTDIGIDLQYENNFGPGSLIFHSTYINEKQNLNASFDAGNSQKSSLGLNSLNVNCNYYIPVGLNFSLGYFLVSGDNDAFLYSPASITGSNTGSPNSNGFVAGVDFFPWQNLKLGVQYVAYNKFNGSINNYDGSGRNASDNNTFYLNSMILF